MLAFRYIAFHYLKYFLIILIALVLFWLGFDYMQHAEKLSKSANLLLIYFVYKSFFAIDMLLPLALVFGMISTKIFLIRSNALVSFYSLGYSRVDILKPFVFVATLVSFIFIFLHSFNSFARSAEYSMNIRNQGQYLSPTRDLFFTYKDKFVYFSKMLPLQRRALGIRVFSIENNSLKEVLVAKEAKYWDNTWHIKSADIIIKPKSLEADSLGMRVVKKQNVEILEGFKPKMLDQVYEGKVNFTIGDAFEAISILDKQNVDVSSIKGALYKIFIYPLFVPCLVVIIFFFVPMSIRFLNISVFSFGAILATLIIWGILFALIELANNKTIPSEVGVVLPVFLLFLLAIRQWRKYRLATS